ncbi:MAG: hypothetical protein ACN6N7_14905, partial [Chryseobacterium culicis]
MKYFLSISILLISFSGVKLHAQINDTIIEKVREEYSFERLIKNSITLNPASYNAARKHSITTFNVFTEKSNTPSQL